VIAAAAVLVAIVVVVVVAAGSDSIALLSSSVSTCNQHLALHISSRKSYNCKDVTDVRISAQSLAL
jgi:hypothetical protein